MVKKFTKPPKTVLKVQKKIARIGWKKKPAVINATNDVGIKKVRSKRWII